MAKTKIEIDLVIKGGESVAQVENKTKSLKAQLKEMKALLMSGTLDNQAFNKLSKEAGELEDRIGDVSTRVKNLASDSKGLDGVISLAQGLVGGFSAVQGVTAMLGDENEDLQKTMVKLQGSMSALAGIQAVVATLNKESAFSTNLLGGAWTKMNNAMKASVIGGIAILVTALIYGLEKLSKVTSGVSSDQEKYNKVMKEGLGDMAEVTKSISVMSNSFDLARKGVISKKEALYEYNKNFGETLGVARNVNEAEKIFREKTEAFIKSSLLRAEATALLNEASKKGVEQVTASMEDNISFGAKTLNVIGGLRNGFISFQADQSIAQAEGTAERKKILQEDIKSFTEIANQKIEEARKIESENQIISKDEQERKKDEKKGNEEALKNKQALLEKEKKAREEFDADKLKKQQELNEVINQLSKQQALNNLSALDKEIQELNWSYDEKLKLVKSGSDLEKELLAQKTFDATQIADKYRKDEADKTLANDKKIADEKKKINEQALADQKVIEEARMSIMNDSYMVINNLGELAIGQQFKNTAVGKSLALTQIAIDTAMAISSLTKNSQANPTNAVTSGLSGIAQFASGMIQITGNMLKAKSILSGGGSASGGGTSSSSSAMGGGNVSSQPPKLETFESNRPAMNPNQRVYVLEKDITDSQGRVARIRHNATLI
jgi:hypothetical protein